MGKQGELPNAQKFVEGPEKVVGVWRRSRWSWSFWWRTIVTLSLYYWLLWRKNQITVTTRRITQRHGNILGGTETTLDLEKITDITINESFLGAIFNYGNVRVQSAGSSAAEISFDMLGRAKKLREVIFDLRDGKWDEKKGN